MLQTREQVHLIELIELISNISFLSDFNFDQNFGGVAWHLIDQTFVPTHSDIAKPTRRLSRLILI